MPELDDRKKLIVMLAIMAALLFAALNQTIVSTALPHIALELHILQDISWIFTAYVLAASIPALLIGRLSDRYGRKPFLVLGLVLFILGSLLAGLAENLASLIVFRVIQGVGGGAIMATAFSAVGDLFPPRQRARWQGALGAVFGLASIIGPVTGGYIVDHWPWPWVFWMTIPLGLVALLLIAILFPAATRKDHHAGGYTGMLRNRAFALSNLIVFIMGASVFAVLIYLPLYLQQVQGISATASGIIMMCMTLALVLASHLGGMHMHRTGRYKGMALLGLVMITLGIGLLAGQSDHAAAGLAYGCIMLMGAGVGVGMSVFNLTLQNAVAHAQLGAATALGQLSRQLGGAVGIACMGMVMGHSLGSSGGDVPDNVLHDALQTGLSQAFTGAALLMLLAVAMVLMIREVPLRSTH